MPKWIVYLKDDEPVLVEGYPRITLGGSLKFYTDRSLVPLGGDTLDQAFCVHAWIRFKRVKEK